MSRKQTITAATKHTAIYIRVSTDEQADTGYGLEAQLDLALAEVAKRGIKVCGVYVDAGVSGTKAAKDRLGMTALLTDIADGKIDTVIITAIDRIARKSSLLLTLWEEIELKGAAVVSVKENIDTSTPFGRMMRSVLAAVAELERDMIVERTSAGRNQRGKVDGDKGGKLPYGYIRSANGVKVGKVQAGVVKFIFELRGQNLALRAIADRLNSSNTPSPKGAKWSAMSIKIVLDNEAAYRGAARNDSPVNWPTILA